jgi:hypothetical protein
MAAPSETLTVYAHPNSEAMGSNPTRGMNVCCCFPVVVLSYAQVTPLRRADPLSKESYQLCTGLRN